VAGIAIKQDAPLVRDHACDRAGGYKQGSPHEQPAADTDYLGLASAVGTYGLDRPDIAVFRIDTKAGSDPPADNSTFRAVSGAHRGNASNVLTSSRIAFNAGSRIGEDADSCSALSTPSMRPDQAEVTPQPELRANAREERGVATSKRDATCRVRR
jgi:hypothetical protein